MIAHELKRARRALVGGYERRSADRYEARLESSVKQGQRDEVAAWFLSHHRRDERMRVLSLPDEHWTFENQLNARPNTSFVGLQRDWKTLERGLPWMPDSGRRPRGSREDGVRYFRVPFATGEVQGYTKGPNKILYMWAGHLLSFDNVLSSLPPPSGLLDREIRKGRRRASRKARKISAVWLDFTGNLCPEVTAAFCGIGSFLGRKKGENAYPVVLSFLACRDGISSHEERVARVLIAMQQDPEQRKSDFRFRFDRFSVHAGSSPFLSIFGTFRNRSREMAGHAAAPKEGPPALPAITEAR